MKASRAPKRYTKAVVELAQDKKVLDHLAADFKSLQAVMSSSTELEAFFKNPLIPATRQIVILQELFQSQVNPLTLVFLKFLAERKKLKFLPQICIEIEKLCGQKRGILKALLTSAIAMKPDQIRSISEKLQTQFGKAIEAENTIDPNLLGGFKVAVGDLIYDLSVRAQLNRFRQKILTA